MYFPVKFEKTQKNPSFLETPEKALGLSEKTPDP